MRPPAAPPLARAALALYPPSWRARYGDEVLALLEESGGGPAAVASLAWRALPAWFCPARHLHDRPARMRPIPSKARAQPAPARRRGRRQPGVTRKPRWSAKLVRPIGKGPVMS